MVINEKFSFLFLVKMSPIGHTGLSLAKNRMIVNDKGNFSLVLNTNFIISKFVAKLQNGTKLHLKVPIRS